MRGRASGKIKEAKTDLQDKKYKKMVAKRQGVTQRPLCFLYQKFFRKWYAVEPRGYGK